MFCSWTMSCRPICQSDWQLVNWNKKWTFSIISRIFMFWAPIYLPLNEDKRRKERKEARKGRQKAFNCTNMYSRLHQLINTRIVINKKNSNLLIWWWLCVETYLVKLKISTTITILSCGFYFFLFANTFFLKLEQCQNK